MVTITDELLVMEGLYAGRGDLPPEHLHPSQDEHFKVREGAVRAVIDGVERRYEAGEAFDVPAGTPHQLAGDGEARLHWEVRPALNLAEFFEVAYSGQAGDDFHERFAGVFRLT